jgi:hypothetical protein
MNWSVFWDAPTGLTEQHREDIDGDPPFTE